MALSKADKNITKREKKKSAALMIAVIVAALFIFQEILFRLIFPLPEASNFNRINYSPVFFGESSTELKHLSNASFIWASDPDKTESTINLNLYGFRTHDFNLNSDEERKRIIFIGDSFTEGYLADDNETIPVSFENAAINKGKEYEVLNLGIGGTDFVSYLKLLKDALPVLQPDHIILMMHGNDLPPLNYKPEMLANPIEIEYNNAYLPRAVYVISNLISGKTVAKFWTTSPFIFFAPVPAPSNPWSNTEQTKNIEKMIKPNIVKAMKEGRFNPFAYNEYSLLRERLPMELKISEHLNGIQNYAEQHNKKIYLVYIPSKNQVHDYYTPYMAEFSSDSSVTALTDEKYQLHAKTLALNCKSLGIPFFDCTEIIKKEENSGNHLYWEYDAHMKAKGYKILGKEIYDWWNKARSE